ncbi:MAG: DUF169 domain-containing protein [Acidobacteria bacterium]|jgi:uncharacterized protein (DUF169 family)|nr:DUF169 domain-containing protein [Acidobacteriota bacterium]
MKNRYTRREALELGLGAVALGASATLTSAAQTPKTVTKEERMPAVKDFNTYGEKLEHTLILRTSPIALKMLETESEIPPGAFRPSRDGKCHIAQCQAFALSRREGKTVAMLKEDHWCPTALMAYGMVEKPDSISAWTHPYDSFERGKYIGVLSAPLKSASFVPDLVVAYMNNAQLRALLLSMKVEEVPEVRGHFFPPSCGYSVVDPIKTGKSWVVLPDPGEYQRALTAEDEIIFSVPRDRMPGLVAGLEAGGMFSYKGHNMVMLPDFEQPQFYKDLFKSWGL